MKQILSFILMLVLLLFVTACSGNLADVSLNEPISIPENGIIKKSVFDEIKTSNSIALFTGDSGEIKYEWKIFGKELEKTKDINLSVDLEKTPKGIKVFFKETEEFGFLALLSIYINDKWNADTATAYNGNTAVCPVSLTGTDATILNLSVDQPYPAIEILPDEKAYTDDAASTDTKTENSSANHTLTDGDDASTPSSNPSSSSNTLNDGDDASTPSSNPSSSGNTLNDGDDASTPSSNPSSSSNTLNDGDDASSTPSSETSSSDSASSEKDKDQTDSPPEDKPTPVEPDDAETDTKAKYTCTFSIECSAILNNLKDLAPDKLELIPSNGVILAPTKVTFYEGESVFDVLQRICKEKGIHLESSWTPLYNSAYIEGIHNLYEFDCGELSGWMYRVNGWYPNYGCSRYQLKDGDVVEWRYTCDLGKDVGEEWMGP